MDHLLRPWLHLDLIPTQQLSEICEAGLWATIIKTQNKKNKKDRDQGYQGRSCGGLNPASNIHIFKKLLLAHTLSNQTVTVCNFATCALKMCQNDLKSSFFLNFLNFCRAFQKYSANNIRKKTLHNLKSLWTDFDLRLRTVNVKYLAGLFCIQFNIVLQKWRSLWSGI